MEETKHQPDDGSMLFLEYFSKIYDVVYNYETEEEENENSIK